MRMSSSLTATVRPHLILQLTLVICAASALYCLLSAAVLVEDVEGSALFILSSRSLSTDSNAIGWTASQQRSAVTTTDVNSADQYDHYSARLSRSIRRAKDALGEMKFRRRRQSVEATAALDRQVPVIAVNATGSRPAGSGLTSLSTAVTDNHGLPAPGGRGAGVSEELRESGDRDSAVDRVEEMWLTAGTSTEQNNDSLRARQVDTSFRLTSSDCYNCINSIPHVLHQTSDDVTVPTQVTMSLSHAPANSMGNAIFRGLPAPKPLGRFSKKCAQLISSGTPPNTQVLG